MIKSTVEQKENAKKITNKIIQEIGKRANNGEELEKLAKEYKIGVVHVKLYRGYYIRDLEYERKRNCKHTNSELGFNFEDRAKFVWCNDCDNHIRWEDMNNNELEEHSLLIGIYSLRNIYNEIQILNEKLDRMSKNEKEKKLLDSTFKNSKTRMVAK